MANRLLRGRYVPPDPPGGPRPMRAFRFSLDCPRGRIFTGADAIAEAEKNGWVDSPTKVNAETTEPPSVRKTQAPKKAQATKRTAKKPKAKVKKKKVAKPKTQVTTDDHRARNNHTLAEAN